MSDTGNIAIVWVADQGGLRVGGFDNQTAQTGYAQVFGPGGAPLTEAIQISGENATQSARVQIVAQPDGGFATPWDDGHPLERHAERAIAGQAFDEMGVPVGPVQRTDYLSGLSDAVALPDGRVIAVIDDRVFAVQDDDFQTVFHLALQEFSAARVSLGQAERVLEDAQTPFGLGIAVDADNRVAPSWRD